jgi:hypothetical protein
MKGRLWEKTTRTSKRPLTLGELESFFDRAWPILFLFEDGDFGAMGTASKRCCVSGGRGLEFYPGIDALPASHYGVGAG